MRSTVVSRIPRRGSLIVAATLLAFVNCEQVEITTVSASRVELQPPTASVAVTETTRLSATVLSSDGKVLSGRAVAWTSLAQNIATVDNTGMVRGMAAGVATIRASSGEASGTATVTVTAAPSIGLAPTDLTFSAVQNGAPPGDRSVTVTNAGTGTLNGLSATVRYAAGEPTAWLTASLATTSAPTALILAANQRNFAPGTYNATVDVASSLPGVATRSVAVHLTVVTPSPAIGMGTNTIAFTATQDGADPAQQTVGLTNAGGGSLTGLATTVDYPTGQRTGWLSAALSGTTAPATLTIRAATGTLPIGTHTGNVRVTSAVAQNSPQTVVVTFNVLSTQAGLALGQTSLALAAERSGANPPPQTVQVSSLGSTQLTDLATTVTYGAGQPTGWLTANLAGTTTPTSIAVTAVTGTLGVGTYNATIAVSSPTASNSPQALAVTFNVAEPLSPVTGLTATPVSGSQINLSWAGQAAAVGRYRIERKTGAGGTYAAIDSVSGTTLAYQSTGLNAATQYFYRIQACNTLGCSAYSAEAGATTGPGAPTSLTASAVSPTQINLTWGASVGSITRYRIERKTGAGGTYAVIDSVPSGTISYQNANLPQTTQFFYRVQACGTLCSGYSNEASATTGLLAPGAPPSLGATAVSAAQIDLSWGASSGTVTSYRIERKTGAGGTYAVIDSTAGTSYQNGGLAAGTQYFYRVQACNTGGCSAYSPEANATTLQVPPGAPSGLSAGVAGPTQISLSWTASSGTVSQYKIERRSGSSGSYAVIDSTTSTGYQNSGLSSGTEYVYRVQACNSAGCSPYSNEAAATTPPSPPSGLSASTVSASQINLGWTAAPGVVSTYRIERKTGAGGTYAVIDSTSSTAYSNSGLSSSTEYFYRVQACNGGGCSGYSNETSATTAAVPPGAPSNLSATPVSSSQINLSWSAATGVVTKYVIERGLTNTSFVVIDSVSGGTTSYANASGLAPQTTYFYRVVACNSAGCSPSNEASATTLPPPPGAPPGLSANAVSASQIDLAWGAASGTVNGYRIERRTSGGSFAQVDTVPGGITSYANGGLSSSTEYFYQVRACNAGGCSAYSNVASDTTFLAPPTAPTSLTATAVSSSQINLAWSGATGIVATYNVFRKDSISGTGYQVVASGTGTSYSDNNVAAGKKYFYQVQACNLAGCSLGFSPEASATTLPPVPSAPGTLNAAAASSTQVNLSWGASTGTVTNYKIERRTSGGSYAVIDSTTSTSYSNTGLNSSTQYFYQVQACNASGCSSYSNEASATTQPVPPSAPTNADALISSGQITVTWSASTGIVDNYRVERRVSPSDPFIEIAKPPNNQLSFSEAGTSAYAYRIRACNAGGCSGYSNVANPH